MQRIEELGVEKGDGLKSCKRRTHERVCSLGSVERKEDECTEVGGIPSYTGLGWAQSKPLDTVSFTHSSNSY